MLRWSDRAIADLIAIRNYIAGDNPAAAAALAQRIRDAVALLDDRPQLGRSGRVAETHELVIAGTSYIAVYTLIEDTVRILAVMHGSRRWPERF